MARVIFFEKPGCGGNGRQKAALSAAGHELEVHDLLAHGWTADELLGFFDAQPVADWFNRASPRVKGGEVVPESLDREAALSLLLADHLLIRRPLLQVDGEKRVGFDPALIDAWIGLEGAPHKDVGEGCPKGEHPSPCPPPAI